jgi:hypothetical protein
MNRQPSLLKIITIDYAALLGWLFPVVMWGMYVVLIVLGNVKTNDFTLPVIFAVITVVALAILIWRIQVFNTIFSDGIETTATINNVSFFRDRGRVDYVYTHQGQKYASGNAIHKVKQTLALKVGEQVVLIVDRNNPKRAFIRDLYM